MHTLPNDHRLCPPWCDHGQCVTASTGGIHHRSRRTVWYCQRAQFELAIHRDDDLDGPGYPELVLTVRSHTGFDTAATVKLRPVEAVELTRRVTDTVARADVIQSVTGLPEYLRSIAAAASEIGKLRYLLGRALDLVEGASLLTQRQRHLDVTEITQALGRQARPTQS